MVEVLYSTCPDFEKKTGYKVKMVAVGSGAAITLGGVALAQFASRSRADAVRDSVPPVD